MIIVNNLSKSFGKQEIFDDISFNVNPGEKIGLVGRNGHGKTTLLRMIIGEEHPDSGEIIIPKNYYIGHVKQHLDFTKNSVIAEACLGLKENESDARWKAEKILAGLGFSQADMEKDPWSFSGGFQVRLNLAKVLVSEPDMLLLDEPTNYLDIISIRWLENFLRQWKGELIIVTHDRSFMNRVITHTIGIHRQKVRKIEGTTDKLYEQILKEEEIYEKTRINDEKKRKEVELFISRFRAKARLAGLVQSRIKALEKQQNLQKLEKIKDLDFSFTYKPFNAKSLMSVENLSFSYDKKNFIIKDLSLSVRSDDRICVIGKNGRGKTTLLRLLAGELSPDSGVISVHPNTVAGYFAQTNIVRLKENLTIEEEIMSAGCDKQTARNIAGAMMFEGDDALKKISVLSGGEKSRVLLGKILATPSNLIFLDEPTNHLDMESCDALMAAIDSYPGAIIMVTHNELFLHSLANRFIVFQESGVRVFEGSYQYFLDKIGWEEEKSDQGKSFNQKDTLNKKDLRKLRSEIITRRNREIKPLEEKLVKTENLITEKEELLAIKNKEIIEASGVKSGKEIESLSKEIHSLQKEINELFVQYEELHNTIEEKKRDFDLELSKLEE
ncbi:MAG TPA: ATP-binding cassette domain-containing protein [Spirochaetota bacterium]|nr:ATP-binding cassette domain-containing protein [Spirochaetota bacterium]HOK91378.1 ATP-binding cassette domain-containing protein [Spirochaetota bacterium]HPP93947.1 ATP-binding cassette domain-containing protein [Spirochaetota bacterium]